MDAIQWEELPLFDPGPATLTEIQTKALQRPVWSENKADLIRRYLRYFVFITRHGTYIDAFAGPQTNRSEEAWTARAVMVSEPKWFRNFHLFDESPSQVARLRQLADDNGDRNIHIYEGDSNRVLPSVLPAGTIGEREATFCLLDQRTFECEWSLCQHIAKLRPGSTKVEQFYFLANSWLPRALAAISTLEGEQKVMAWLDSEDWQSFAKRRPFDRVDEFVRKFKEELGYRSVKAWPIYERDAGAGVVMYYMVHATDHEEAPKLMYRAYCRAVDPPEPAEQLRLDLGSIIIGDETRDRS